MTMAPKDDSCSKRCVQALLPRLLLVIIKATIVLYVDEEPKETGLPFVAVHVI